MSHGSRGSICQRFPPNHQRQTWIPQENGAELKGKGLFGKRDTERNHPQTQHDLPGNAGAIFEQGLEMAQA